MARRRAIIDKLNIKGGGPQLLPARRMRIPDRVRDASFTALPESIEPRARLALWPLLPLATAPPVAMPLQENGPGGHLWASALQLPEMKKCWQRQDVTAAQKLAIKGTVQD